MNSTSIIQAIKGALVADAYALGAHWIYDEHQLTSLPVNWDDLNAPQAMWHKGKQRGDFTHYGDHALWLYEYIQQFKSFNINEYKRYWLEKMETYSGYIDGSSRETLAKMDQDASAVHGSSSHDLSIIGRIAPLLLITSSKNDFLNMVKEFIAFTHNSALVIDAGSFFASVLYDVVEGKTIDNALMETPIPSSLTIRFDHAVESKGDETFQTIRKFGPACGIEGGFEGVIHILISHDDYKNAMIANAKAGGDNAARGMIVGMLLGAAGASIPSDWERSALHLPDFNK